MENNDTQSWLQETDKEKLNMVITLARRAGVRVVSYDIYKQAMYIKSKNASCFIALDKNLNCKQAKEAIWYFMGIHWGLDKTKPSSTEKKQQAKAWFYKGVQP